MNTAQFNGSLFNGYGGSAPSQSTVRLFGVQLTVSRTATHEADHALLLKTSESVIFDHALLLTVMDSFSADAAMEVAIKQTYSSFAAVEVDATGRWFERNIGSLVPSIYDGADFKAVLSVFAEVLDRAKRQADSIPLEHDRGMAGEAALLLLLEQHGNGMAILARRVLRKIDSKAWHQGRGTTVGLDRLARLSDGVFSVSMTDGGIVVTGDTAVDLDFYLPAGVPVTRLAP